MTKIIDSRETLYYLNPTTAQATIDAQKASRAALAKKLAAIYTPWKK